MNRWLANALGVAGVVVLCVLGWALAEWAIVGKTLNSSVTQTTSIVNQLNVTLAKLNGPTGTIAEVDKLLLALKSTTVHVDIAARHEDQQLTVLDVQERQLFADAHGTLGEVQKTAAALTGTAQQATATLGEAQRTIQVAQPLVASLDTTAKASTAAVNSLNARITDPHVDSLMAHLDSTTGHIDGIAADAQYKLHGLLHPDKVKLTFWTATQAGVQWIHSNIIPPLF
jgi:hypothetical protein